VGALALVVDTAPPEHRNGATGHIVLDRYRIDDQGNVCLTNPGLSIVEMEASSNSSRQNLMRCEHARANVPRRSTCIDLGAGEDRPLDTLLRQMVGRQRRKTRERESR
jgi:hypothetical protein